MPTAASIKAIHAAATYAKLPDSEYRGILARVGRCHGLRLHSSKQLPQKLVGEVIAEITRRRTQPEPGWTVAQMARIRSYQKLADVDDPAMRVILHEISGHMHESSPRLTQYHFDRLMTRLEMRVADRVARGEVQWPSGMAPTYWRTRNRPGHINRRQQRRIAELWEQLMPFLSDSERTTDYLCGIAAHGCGRRVQDIHSLTAWQAANVIDALKDRLHYALKDRLHYALKA
jgi:hypothetical protein